MMLKLVNTNFINIRNPISINNTGINTIVLSNKISFGKKDFRYFIGHKDAKKIIIIINYY